MEDNRYIVQQKDLNGLRKVVVLAPTTTKMTSYHASGKSDGELYRENWRRAKCLTQEFRR